MNDRKSSLKTVVYAGLQLVGIIIWQIYAHGPGFGYELQTYAAGGGAALDRLAISFAAVGPAFLGLAIGSFAASRLPSKRRADGAARPAKNTALSLAPGIIVGVCACAGAAGALAPALAPVGAFMLEAVSGLPACVLILIIAAIVQALADIASASASR